MYKDLGKLGLSENEAKIYIALLSGGAMTASNASKRTQIKRPTAYLALENLKKLGLVSENLDKKTKIFKPEPPEKLSKLTKKMRREIIAAELKLEELMPALKSIENKILETPKISFYESLGGVKSMLDDVILTKEPWYFFGSSENIIRKTGQKEIDEMTEDSYQLRKLASQPKAHFITDRGIMDIPHFKNTAPAHIREIKILPKTISTHSGFIIYENKLAIFSLGEHPFGAIFESREASELLKIFYNLLWKSL